MVNVDIDKELYEHIKGVIKKKKYDYASVKFFVQKAIYNQLLISEDNFDTDFDKFYSKIKEILQNKPELKSKVDEIYASEIKKIKKGVLQ